jgi:hypothetical protein
MKKLIILAAVVAVIASTGCKSEKPEESGSSELRLYCGAGIRPPVAQMAEAFEREHGVKVVVDYAGSEVLLSKIKLVRKGDLYMPGDKHYVDQAEQEGMILSQQSACYFVPTILVRKGNPKNIGGLQDLVKADLKLGLGDAKACAIGRKTKQIFAKNNRRLLPRARYGGANPAGEECDFHGERRRAQLYREPPDGREVRRIRHFRCRAGNFCRAQLSHRARGIERNRRPSTPCGGVLLVLSKYFPCERSSRVYNALFTQWSVGRPGRAAL